MRAALPREQASIDTGWPTNTRVIVAPIVYYNTPLGAVVAAFNLNALSKRYRVTGKSGYYKLIRGMQEVVTDNFSKKEVYISHRAEGNQGTPQLQSLNLALEIGFPESLYLAPVAEALVRTISLGLLLIVIAIALSFWIGNGIARPILELYRRVKSSDLSTDQQCSPLGTNDELEVLAEAFDQRTNELRGIQSQLQQRVKERTL